MRRDGLSSARWAARVPARVVVLCAVALSACLNPIPDDFPNDRGSHVDEDRPGTEIEPSGSAGGGNSGPALGSGDEGGDIPVVDTPVDEEAGGTPQAPDPAAAPDAGVGDAGGAGGTLGGG